MIFQIVFSLILGDTKMTPFAIGLTQLIHNTCRSKHLISFQQIRVMQRIDTLLTQRIINQAVSRNI